MASTRELDPLIKLQELINQSNKDPEKIIPDIVSSHFKGWADSVEAQRMFLSLMYGGVFYKDNIKKNYQKTRKCSIIYVELVHLKQLGSDILELDTIQQFSVIIALECQIIMVITIQWLK